MKPEELRIGNWIHLPSKGKDYQIISGHDIEEIESSNDAKPIEITEKWLFQFGFNKHQCLKSDIMWRHPHDKKTVRETLHCLNFYWQDKAFIFIEIVNDHGEYGTYPLGHIKHVHQLQNLYYALTGKELTIK